MNETSAIPEEMTERTLDAPSLRVIQLSLRARLVLWFYGFVLPLVCFGLAAAPGDFLIDQPWQSGDVSAYAAMLLRPTAWLPFAPWLLLSLCSMAMWTYRPSAARKLWVRFGLYSGVVLAVQFWIVVVVSESIVTLIAAAFVLPSVFGLSLLVASVAAHYKRFQIWHLLVLTTVVAMLAAATQVMPSYVLGSLFAVPFFVLAAAPTLNLIAYIRAAWTVSPIDGSQSNKLGWLSGLAAGWTLGWLVSWRFAVQAMLDEYSRLPTTNPNCYFANAAAHAHGWIGGTGSSQPCRSCTAIATSHLGSHQAGQVTLAMRRLKFLELTLMATMPRLHRTVRRYYDRWGEPAARYCQQSCGFATLTCLALKPLEALAELVRIAAGISQERLSAIYRQD